MKRFIFSLVALVITSVCFAQDIIVQKDGNTITAKVLKVSQSEVEYKKFGNQDGPTYTISTRDLQCINYENGSKDTFVSPNYNPNIVTNETATQFSNDQQLLAMYELSPKLKKAKRLKTTAWIGAGVFAAIGIAGQIAELTYENPEPFLGPFVVGAIWWASFYFPGKHLEKKYANTIQSSSIYQQEFNIGKNNRLMVGVDMLKDNTRKNQTLGLGVSYNF